jgi:hypothetical protein
VRNGRLTMQVQEPVTVPDTETDDADDTKVVASDLNGDNNTASVLLRDAPRSQYMVETAVRLNIPDAPECCYNYAQGGVLVYDSDDNFVKLTNTSIWNTRQTEWAKEIFPSLMAGAVTATRSSARHLAVGSGPTSGSRSSG